MPRWAQQSSRTNGCRIRIRRVLNVESGLNDGIATPFVNFFLVAAVAGTTLEHGSLGGAVVDLLVGVAFGAVVGYVGGWALARWGAGASTASRNVGALSLSLIAYAGAVEIGANGFVAAFIAGLAYGTAERRRDEHPFAETLNLTHQGAELLSLTVWFLFGAVMMPQLTDATWRDVVFAVLALTVLRIAPVWLSLVGVDFDRSTVGVIGWFGPRGLASVVFALMAVGELPAIDGERVLVTITMTVTMSVILHGATAAPIAARYGSRHAAGVDQATASLGSTGAAR